MARIGDGFCFVPAADANRKSEIVNRCLRVDSECKVLFTDHFCALAKTVELDDSLRGMLAIDCQDLSFSFAEGQEPVLKGVDLELQRGSRCLLVGANGGVS